MDGKVAVLLEAWASPAGRGQCGVLAHIQYAADWLQRQSYTQAFPDQIVGQLSESHGISLRQRTVTTNIDSAVGRNDSFSDRFTRPDHVTVYLLVIAFLSAHRTWKSTRRMTDHRL